jgi:hypothetical protein
MSNISLCLSVCVCVRAHTRVINDKLVVLVVVVVVVVVVVAVVAAAVE